MIDRDSTGRNSRRVLNCARTWAWLVLLSLGLLAACGGSSAPDVYPGPLTIEKNPILSEAETDVEREFADELQKDVECSVRMYRRAFGKVLNTDSARELSPRYSPGGIVALDTETRNARSKWSAAVQEPASALVKDIYKRMLAEDAPKGSVPLVFFLAGGAGAGKTTSVDELPEVGSVKATAQIVYDTTLSNLNSAVSKIEMAFAAKKDVYVVYVYREPLDAFRSALDRAMREGRTLPVAAFVATHIGALDVFMKVTDRYYDGSTKFKFDIVNNSLGRGKQEKVTDIATFVKTIPPYDRLQLEAILETELKSAYEKTLNGQPGGISKEVYDGFMGKKT